MTYLLRLGELTLRGRNRRDYEAALIASIREKLRRIEQRRDVRLSVERKGDRILVESSDVDDARMEEVLSATFGLAGYAPVRIVEKEPEILVREAVDLGRSAGLIRPTTVPSDSRRSFRVRVRRVDKSFSPGSEAFAAVLGDAIRGEDPDLQVDLKHGERTLTVEIRDRAYLYLDDREGLRGLPSGTQGRALALLSAGIDSPVAAYQMAFRGMDVDCLHFSSYPFVSRESLDKVRRLASILRRTQTRLAFLHVDMAEVVRIIAEGAPERERTLLLRRAMMDLAQDVATARGQDALVTGECIGQVASQSVESIAFTGGGCTLPVLRPLAGLDKEEIVARARRIGTYDVSCEPYDDFCALLASKNPLTRPSGPRLSVRYTKLGLGPAMARARESLEEG